MRYAGLCSILLVIPAACDDAVGAGYPAETSPSAIEAASPDAPPPEESGREAGAGAAESADAPASAAAVDVVARE